MKEFKMLTLGNYAVKNLLSVIVVFCSITGLSSILHAETVACDNIITSRCPLCRAAMEMNCNGMTGLIKNDAKLDHLRVIITSASGQQRTVTLQNPPGGIRDYYAIEYNDWVPTQIRDLRYGDKIEVAENGYGINDRTPLYRDINAREQIGTVGSSSRSNSQADQLNCLYARGGPYVISYPSSCSRQICSSMVDCYDSSSNRWVEAATACPARSNGSCPTANECVTDESTGITSSPRRAQLGPGIREERGPRGDRGVPGIR